MHYATIRMWPSYDLNRKCSRILFVVLFFFLNSSVYKPDITGNYTFLNIHNYFNRLYISLHNKAETAGLEQNVITPSYSHKWAQQIKLRKYSNSLKKKKEKKKALWVEEKKDDLSSRRKGKENEKKKANQVFRFEKVRVFSSKFSSRPYALLLFFFY